MDWSPVWISLKTTVTATLITFVLGIVLARWRYGYRGPGGGVIDAVLLLPLALPPTVIGLGLLMFFGRNSPVGQALESLGVTIIFSWEATVIAAVVASFPLMYQTTQAAFRQIDHELIDVARLFGFTEWQILWRVMIPLAWPGVLAGVVLSFVRALGEFGATLMLAGNLPGRTQTIPLAIFFSIDSGEQARALVLAGITLVISFTALLLTRFSDARVR